MRLPFGFSSMSAYQRGKLLRRGGLVIGAFVSVFSFVTIDLARKDAILTVGAFPSTVAGQEVLTVSMTNSSTYPMEDAKIRFAFYDQEGQRIRHKDPTTRDWGKLEESYFVPFGMAIGPQAGKDGHFPVADFEKSVDQIKFVFVCGDFEGSFWVDRVRTEYVLIQSMPGYFGQDRHETDIHLLTTPDCMPPERLEPRVR